jgi:ribosomal protein RSM22 (predicted rRNA methylase)
MRITIPKSQGKQAYYDARKSSWGDIFPHPPKNPPQERSVTSRKGSDIGKRKNSIKSGDRPTYDGLSETIREQRKKSRAEYYRVRDEQSAFREDSE